MKRRSDLSGKYHLYRIVPYFCSVQDESGLVLKSLSLKRPKKVKRVGKDFVVEIIQEMPKGAVENENWIIDSLKREALSLFNDLKSEEIIVKLEYE